MEKGSHSPLPVPSEKQSTSRPQTSRARAVSLPEVDLYIHLLILLYLIDRNSLKSVEKINFSLHFLFDLHRLSIVLNVWLIKPVYSIVVHSICYQRNVISTMLESSNWITCWTQSDRKTIQTNVEFDSIVLC